MNTDTFHIDATPAGYFAYPKAGWEPGEPLGRGATPDEAVANYPAAVEDYEETLRMRRAIITKARHMRGEEDYAAILARAEQRRERRMVEVGRLTGWFPTPELWRTLDLAHEATYLIDRLESRREAAHDSAAEAQWEDRFA